MHAAAIDDAAQALLLAWDVAREQVTPRLSSVQLSALLAVERSEGLNLGGLAAELAMLLSSASRLCDRLVASGMVERVPGRAAGRAPPHPPPFFDHGAREDVRRRARRPAARPDRVRHRRRRDRRVRLRPNGLTHPSG
jgi:hypothetical protein